MLSPITTTQFKKDIKKIKKQNKDMHELKAIMTKLIDEIPLDTKHKDHKLTGNYLYRRECHIQPNWLLIYKLLPTEIIFERTGSHSELFK